MLNSLWRAYSQKCREDFYDDLGKANTNRQMLQLMINKDLFNSAEERKRISETGDKPAIVTQFEKEFKEKTGEISRLLSSTRRLSFKSGTANKATFHEKFGNCIEELMEIEKFQSWALNEKKDEWNEMLKLQGME